MNRNPFPIAIAQMPISGDACQNGEMIRSFMKEAAVQGARLLQFPEGALSGYAKNPIMSWDEVNWDTVRSELETIMALAKELNQWVVLGSAHPLTPPRWPHNSLYIISDDGKLHNRYDKRLCSYTETTRFYTRGTEAITFEVDGYTFGCLICVEINFPELFIEYGELGIDCLLLSAYPVDEIFYTKAQAYAAIHNIWIGLSTPAETSSLMQSSLIGPDGYPSTRVETPQGIAVGILDPSAPEYNVPLNHARPWRASVSVEEFPVDDERSTDRTCI